LSLKNGIDNDHDSNKKTTCLLDAIASICVSKKKNQVIAIGLHLNPGKSFVNIITAGNQDVPDQLIQHLENIWRKLQNLSKIHNSCQDSGSTYQIKQHLHKDCLALHMEIFRDINLYCLAKQLKRLELWVERLIEFVGMLLDHRESQGCNMDNIEQRLSGVVDRVSKILEFLQALSSKMKTTEDEWQNIFLSSIYLSEEVEMLLDAREGPTGDRCKCESLANQLYRVYGIQFYLKFLVNFNFN